MGAAFILLASGRGRAEGIVPSTAQEAGLDDWPASWAATYRRFEGFLSARKQYWPAAGLRLVGDTSFAHAIPETDSKSRVGLEVFAAGATSLHRATRRTEATDLSVFPPGIYCVCAKTTGTLGYQYHFPLMWWESVRREGAPTERSRPNANMIRVIPAPGEGMAVWPNERLLAYMDFHIFTGHRDPNQILKENESMIPAVRLGCDQHGTIHREILADGKAEGLLRWRIYHDGKLVNSGNASGIGSLDLKQGPGNYLVILGADGPAGFLPASNFLMFPLFPDGDGKPLIVPRDTDSDGTPDFIEEMMASGDAGTVDVPDDQDSDGDGLTDIEEAGPRKLLQAEQPKERERELLRLWGQWEYELTNLGTWWK